MVISGITEVFRFFSAAGENFPKNDQNQWFLYQNRIFMRFFGFIFVKYFHNHEKFKKWSKISISKISEIVFFSPKNDEKNPESHE